jgi:hypothetical protein
VRIRVADEDTQQRPSVLPTAHEVSSLGRILYMALNRYRGVSTVGTVCQCVDGRGGGGRDFIPGGDAGRAQRGQAG